MKKKKAEAIAYGSAFFDRMHYYLPGWEIPKIRPEDAVFKALGLE